MRYSLPAAALFYFATSVFAAGKAPEKSAVGVDKDVDAETREFRSGGYLVRVHQEETAEDFQHWWFEVRSDGRRIFKSERAHGYDLEAEHHDNVRLKPGADLTGDGRPNLVVGRVEGGNICWKTVIVYELNPTAVKELQRIKLCNGNLWFRDLDSDGFPEIVVRKAFAMELSGVYLDLYTDVVLKWADGRYRFSDGLMRKPTPSAEAVAEEAARLAVTDETLWEDDHCPHDGSNTECRARRYLFETMIDWMISGNAHQAFQLYRAAWPDEVEGKKDVLAAFRARMREYKKFWRNVLRMNSKREGSGRRSFP